MVLILMCTCNCRKNNIEDPGARKHTKKNHLVLGIWDVLIQLNWTRISILKLNLEISSMSSNYDSLWFDFSCENRIGCLRFCIHFSICILRLLGIGLSMYVMLDVGHQIKVWLKNWHSFNLANWATINGGRKSISIYVEHFSIIFINLRESLIWQ